VPLELNRTDRKRYCDLAGVSAEVTATFGTAQFREKMLITHRGLSGPAILQISSYWEKNRPLVIDLAPDREIVADLCRSGKPKNLAALKTALHEFLPARLAERWLEFHPPKRFTDSALFDWERQLHHWNVTPSGTEGLTKAEVTAGGVECNELSAQTMECKNVPGLFFIGEVVDVTGHLGGFNFQWAWSSGAAAGRAV
jgi:predicted Rossmann fold flavoprotein